MCSIQVDSSQEDRRGSKLPQTEEVGGMAGALARALADRSKVIHSGKKFQPERSAHGCECECESPTGIVKGAHFIQIQASQPK